MKVKRGQIYLADLNPYQGSEQGGIRPVLILQNDTGNLYSHTTIIASQFTPDGWHKNLGGGAIADAILDRIVSSSYTIHIKGDKSMRARKKD